MARPTIGDFRGSDQNKPRPPPAAPTEEKEEAAADETAETSAAEKPNPLKNADFLTPAEKYRERLKGQEIDLKTAEAIYDSVLTKGYHEEYIRIRGNHRAVFRTRMYEDHLRLQTILEMQKPQLAISQDELITRFNLAASLYEWDGKQLKHETEEDFDAVMKIVRRLPGPLFTVLSRELAKFDTKVMAVFDEGADENF
jgi:hypothetical protein